MTESIIYEINETTTTLHHITNRGDPVRETVDQTFVDNPPYWNIGSQASRASSAIVVDGLLWMFVVDASRNNLQVAKLMQEEWGGVIIKTEWVIHHIIEEPYDGTPFHTVHDAANNRIHVIGAFNWGIDIDGLRHIKCARPPPGCVVR